MLLLPKCLTPIIVLLAGAPACLNASEPPQFEFAERTITVDGRLDDWDGIKPNKVAGKEHLWFGQGMTAAGWSGDDDLRYDWRGAWFGNRLFFAVVVDDDRLTEPTQPSSYLCDCVEIYVDYNHQRGRRVKVLDGREDWAARFDPREMMGYEMHFVAADPPRVYLDHRSRYATDKPHNDEFKNDWSGEAAFRKTDRGYVLEIGFRIPGVDLRAGKTLGIEIGICDDDGRGRESIMMWTGTKGDFWITMDEFGRARLRGAAKPDRVTARALRKSIHRRRPQ